MSNQNTVRTITEFARVAGVSRSAVYRWRDREDFPAMPCTPAAVRVYAKARLHHAAEMQTGDNADLKAEKLRKQIARLDVQNAIDGERLKREQIETKRARGLMVLKADMEKEARRIGGNLDNALRSWKTHETAKRPALRDAVVALEGQLRALLVDALASEGGDA